MQRQLNKLTGFTLFEILIALFIFSILSVLMIAGLRTVINAESGVEKNAVRFRQLQFALLILSRDIEQAVDRPIWNASTKEDPAFIGTPSSFTFTHLGFANNFDGVAKSTMQRTQYLFQGDSLTRVTWPVLDRAPTTQTYQHALLSEVSEVRFEYLGEKNRFYPSWPLSVNPSMALPLAIRVYLSFSTWGKMSALYVLPTQSISKQ